MGLAKASHALMLTGAVGLGIWIGPHLTKRQAINEAPPATQVAAPVAETKQAEPVPSRPSVHRRTSAKRAAPSAVATVKVPASAPELQQRLKPLLNKGANMDVAAQEFRDGEQFAMVAHAARNTEIPFMLLKHRVVDEGKSLTEAIREFKPELDAAGQAERARAEAKSDVTALKG